MIHRVETFCKTPHTLLKYNNKVSKESYIGYIDENNKGIIIL